MREIFDQGISDVPLCVEVNVCNIFTSQKYLSDSHLHLAVIGATICMHGAGRIGQHAAVVERIVA
eukprot:scaffold20737_cov125-Skeletonema_dohrnii-CCMP3373.AAC.3